MSIRPRILSDFLGKWRLARRIVHVNGPAATFQGTACWSPGQRGLVYHEIGQLHMPGATPITGERRYLWDAGLCVFFEDGRYFHQVPATGGDTAHWCDPDQYDGSYDFEKWPKFRVIWNVRGPRKDYRMVTDFTRI